jgi:hypothetical protein
MRMMLTASIPNEPFNSLVRSGEANSVMKDILTELKPEAAYFVEEDGKRCAVLIIDVADQSRIPSFAEPFFLKFNAECRFRIAMVAEDLGKAGLEEIGKKWR